MIGIRVTQVKGLKILPNYEENYFLRVASCQWNSAFSVCVSSAVIRVRAVKLLTQLNAKPRKKKVTLNSDAQWDPEPVGIKTL